MKKKKPEERRGFRVRRRRRGERRHHHHKHWAHAVSRHHTCRISCKWNRLGRWCRLQSFWLFGMKKKIEEEAEYKNGLNIISCLFSSFLSETFTVESAYEDGGPTKPTIGFKNRENSNILHLNHNPNIIQKSPKDHNLLYILFYLFRSRFERNYNQFSKRCSIWKISNF